MHGVQPTKEDCIAQKASHSANSHQLVCTNWEKSEESTQTSCNSFYAMDAIAVAQNQQVMDVRELTQLVIKAIEKEDIPSLVNDSK